jgi:hypothetical protein
LSQPIHSLSRIGPSATSIGADQCRPSLERETKMNEPLGWIVSAVTIQTACTES